ncbi:S-adenosyl-L-methionine-dependent methyltransferase [Talaromyces proteolyticus]|uniref:S-adenosyl-L-methionine-dependent methyltransferase n=1 Tax=Talaromyces proteolyticus TaxID=1131652 RepID=A0AAD4KZX6_9EURO|nr:S-adenosyl-L-methionine-dependent methyltransferase [Talaromyces proteolyticus]KAH8702602.1 S-adenosyl-L-methionine-dependent methyltransferase [Talaromyces proteolyticus]
MVQSFKPSAEPGSNDRIAQTIEVEVDDEDDQYELLEGEREIVDDSNNNDDDDNDNDDDEDGTYSITSTRSQFTIQPVYENGRRYCNDTYFMPNDDAEQTRLNIVHQAFLMLLDGELTKAPAPNGPSRILDIGTGPGDWAVEMGEMYPNAEIIATDISVFDAGPGIIGLPNVHFQLDDAEEEWTYHEPFDLIHFRCLTGAFRNWDGVYRQAFKHLRAGGYIEVAESEPDFESFIAPELKSDSYYNILASAMRSAADATDFPRGRDHLRSSSLTAVGFVDVRTYDITVPVGTWPDDPKQRTLGKMILIVFLEGLEARSLRQLTATGNWTAEGVRDICEKARLEIAVSKGASVTVRFMTGRKPMSHAPHRLRRQLQIQKLVDEMKKSELQ